MCISMGYFLGLRSNKKGQTSKLLLLVMSIKQNSRLYMTVLNFTVSQYCLTMTITIIAIKGYNQIVPCHSA